MSADAAVIMTANGADLSANRARGVDGTVLALSPVAMPRTTFDQTVKFLADHDPEALLRAFGPWPREGTARVTKAPRDVPLPARLPDLLYEVSSDTERWIAHVEVQTEDTPAMDDRMVEYMVLAWWTFRQPIRSVLVVLTPRGGTRPSPREVVGQFGGLRLIGRYEVVRLWEVPAALFLTAGRPTLLPFVPLMAGTKADAVSALRHMRDMPDGDVRRELLVRFTLLGGLRYDKMELLKLVEERSMETLDDLSASSFYQFIVEEGLRKGLEEGLEKGEGRGETKLLRRLLERRFGPLPSWAVERMKRADRAMVEAWADRFVDANGIPLEELLSS